MCIPTEPRAFLDQLVPTVAALGDVPQEVHHAHVLACTFLARNPVLEVYYDNPWLDEDMVRRQWGRADLWAPAATGANQLYVEAKLALLYDRSSRRLGDPRYGLLRAAPDWAWDVWRLLVGPSGPTCCGFLLCVYSQDGSDLFPGWAPAGTPLAPLAPNAADADAIYDQIAALVALPTAVDAIRALEQLVVTQLQGRVGRFGSTPIPGMQLAADPLLFEWAQQDAQRTSYR
jgi:hypothetical protein